MKTLLSVERALELSADLGAGGSREAELVWLAYQASRHIRIAEVGAWIGATTIVLAENTPGTVVSVDTWDGGTDEFIKGIIAEHEIDWAYRQFVSNTRGMRNLSWVRKESVLARDVFSSQGRMFDMIFIDGSHDYESVLADIKAWNQLLSPGGLLCGDDYEEKLFPGVVRAVDEFGSASVVAGSLWACVGSKYAR